MPAMPEGVARRHPQGHVQAAAAADDGKAKLKVQLFGSGAILREVLRGAGAARREYDVAADVWSVTSYKELHATAMPASAGTCCIPTEAPQKPYVDAVPRRTSRACSSRRRDYMQGAAGDDRPLGAGRSVRSGHRRLRPQRGPRVAAPALRGRRPLRRARHARRAGPRRPARRKVVAQAIKDLGIDPEKLEPAAKLRPSGDWSD